MKNLRAEYLADLATRFENNEERARIVQEITNFPSHLAQLNVARFMRYLCESNRSAFQQLLEQVAASKSHTEPLTLLGMVEKAAIMRVAQVAITVEVSTKEIVGIHITHDDHNETMGVQTVLNGLVDWRDVEGIPHWSQGKGDGAATGSYKSMWIETQTLLDRLLAS